MFNYLPERLHIVEIKKAKYTFSDGDFERLIVYVHGFREFWDEHKEIRNDFPGKWCIDLIADGIELSKPTNRESFDRLIEKGEVKRTSWKDFLHRTENAHQLFLDVNERIRNIESE